MRQIESLFDTRGGSLLIDRCESCNDELPEQSCIPVCDDCLRSDEEAGEY